MASLPTLVIATLVCPTCDYILGQVCQCTMSLGNNLLLQSGLPVHWCVPWPSLWEALVGDPSSLHEILGAQPLCFSLPRIAHLPSLLAMRRFVGKLPSELFS